MDSARQIPFVDKISALRFKLFDQNNAVITNPALAASVRFIRVEIDTLSPDGSSVTITGGAALRK